ncbi:tyrosine-type recombinase/integrase [Phycobacter sp. K97]|uniref:tyrosine-type recombinase/integrase n=1 Tax=Phycobacter sedimenti TaxID=3133977 RepID=UPI00311F3481
MNGSLTATFVRNIKAPGVYSDKNGTGLRLRVKPDGRKHWLQRFTLYGKVREAGLGSYPIVTLAMAREQALENRRAVRDGVDPISEKQKNRAVLTFADAVEEYLKIRMTEFRNEKHKKQWRATLDTYAVPIVGSIYVRDLTREDVIRVLEPIWKDKTETATRLRQRIEAVISWAIVSGHRETTNPAVWKGNLSEVLPNPSRVKQQKNHPAVQVTEAADFWKELSKREGMGATALRFLTLTASRSGEVRGMTWDEVDFEKRLWIIPKERMKARREHRAALSDAAMDLLLSMPKLEGCDFVFFSSKGGQLSDMSLSAVMRRMDEAAQANGGARFLDGRSKLPAVPHGLRSTFRDWAAENGVDHTLAELALAHNVGSTVERAYRRSDLVQNRFELMNQWAAHLEGRGRG